MEVRLSQFSHNDNKITGTIDNYEFQAKHYDYPSEYGIENSRTSKLDISKDSKIIIAYNRGWDIEPNTIEQKQMCEELVEYLEKLPKRFDNELIL
jgi:hypothetical protein